MDHKIARLCWNSKRWQLPTGLSGKSRDKDAYERTFGFGHEEWLFDTSKVVGGYIHGYVRAVANSREKYLSERFDLSLYSINGETKQRWWVGTIRNVAVVGATESAEVYAYYKENGWLDQMRMQIRDCGADLSAFDQYVTPEIFSVIKFTIDDIEIFDEPVEFDYRDPAVRSDHYILQNFVQLPRSPSFKKDFVFRAGHQPPSKKKKMTYQEHERLVNDFHVDVQNTLFRILSAKHGKKNVGTEQHTGEGSRIDLVVKDGSMFTLYEIKIGPSLRSCVREAIGQLLEYRHAIGPEMVSKLVIVSPHKPDTETDKYLEAMRTKHHIPLHYEQCEGTM